MKTLELIAPLAAVAFLARFTWRWSRLGLGHGPYCGCARCDERDRARRLREVL